MSGSQDEQQLTGTSTRIPVVHYLFITAVLLLATVPFLISEWQQAGQWGFPLDDSWIHCQYARNLATGRGFVYNPGDPPSNGSTAPLWTLLAAAAYRLTGEFPVTLKVVGILLAVGSALLTAYIIWLMFRRRDYALIGGIGTALMPPLIWAGLLGMEPALYTFLVLLGIAGHIKLAEKPWTYQLLPTAILAAAVTARPETGLIFVFVLVDGWVRGRGADIPRRRLLLRTAGQVAVFAILLVPYMWYNWQATGLPYPNTYSAKMPAEGSLSTAALRLLAGPFQAIIGQIGGYVSVNVVVTLLFAAGLVYLIVHRPRGWLIVPLSAVGYVVFRWMAAPVGSFMFQGNRYYTHCFPLAVIVAVAGLAELEVQLRRRGIEPRRIIVVVAFLTVLAYAPGLHSWVQAHGTAVKNIAEMQVHLGKWLASNTPSGSLIATNDIGAIAFFSGRPILDLVGLVNPEIFPHVYPGTEPQPHTGLARDSLLPYLIRKNPDYLLIFPNWYPQLAQQSDLLEPVYSVCLPDNIVCGSGDPMERMVLYKTKFTDS